MITWSCKSFPSRRDTIHCFQQCNWGSGFGSIWKASSCTRKSCVMLELEWHLASQAKLEKATDGLPMLYQDQSYPWSVLRKNSFCHWCRLWSDISYLCFSDDARYIWIYTDFDSISLLIVIIIELWQIFIEYLLCIRQYNRCLWIQQNLIYTLQ